MLVKDVDAGDSTASGAEVFYVPTDVVVRSVAPFTLLSSDEVRALVQRFDQEGKGGLSEVQWIRFCEQHHKRFSSLGPCEIGFERPENYAAFTAADEASSASRAVRGVVRFLEGFAAGGIAGAISKTIIAPADKVKIIFQVDSQRRFSLYNAYELGVSTVKEHGITGLWIGNGATMVRVIPYAAVTFVTFDYYYEGFQCLLSLRHVNALNDEGTLVGVRFLSGSLSGATATACTYPLDLMRARLAAHNIKEGVIPSYRRAYRSLMTDHGWRSLYSGLVPTLIGIMPYAGCSFAVFETLKSYVVRWRGLPSEKSISVPEKIVAGGFAGLVAQSATYPLDIVRRRMQVTPGRYHGVLHALCTIYREEGLIQGWYKGLTMNWIKGPIAVSTAFTVNDVVKRRMREYDEESVRCSRGGSMVSLPGGFACGLVSSCTAHFCTVTLLWFKAVLRASFRTLHERVNGGYASPLAGLLYTGSTRVRVGDVAVMQVVSYGALTYSLFDICQTASERLLFSLTPTPTTNFVAGAMASTVSTAAMYPISLMCTRAMAHKAPSLFHSHYWLLHNLAKPPCLRSFREWSFFCSPGCRPHWGCWFRYLRVSQGAVAVQFFRAAAGRWCICLFLRSCHHLLH